MSRRVHLCAMVCRMQSRPAGMPGTGGLMDKMVIRDMTLRCIIGTRPVERKRKQRVIINLALDCDLSRAGRSDRLEDTVNYSRLVDRVKALVVKSRFQLIERLADRVAATCLADRGVKAVTVTVDKPGALADAKSAAVEIRRGRGLNRRSRR